MKELNSTDIRGNYDLFQDDNFIEDLMKIIILDKLINLMEGFKSDYINNNIQSIILMKNE